MGVENVPLRAPYIEGEVWGSSLPTEFKGRMSNKMNSAQFLKEPEGPKLLREIAEEHHVLGVLVP